MEFTLSEYYLIIDSLKTQRNYLINSERISYGNDLEEIQSKVADIDFLLSKFDEPIKKDQQDGRPS